MGAGGQRVFARADDDDVVGGAGNDRLRGGHGDDYLNGGGDGGDEDRIVCGDGYDVVVLGRNDVVLVEVQASTDVASDAGDPAGDDADDPLLEEPESSDDDGCEKVKGPGAPRSCASHDRSCGDDERTCASNDGGCDDPVDQPCGAHAGACDDPVDQPCAAHAGACDDGVATDPEPDPPADQPVSDDPPTV